MRLNRAAAAAIICLMPLVAVPARAQSLPRLVADDFKITRSAESPGQVLFNHSTHVDSARPECTSCHAGDFRMLKASAGARKIAHQNFEKGRQCGRCHDGKHAFAIDADCTNCHRG